MPGLAGWYHDPQGAPGQYRYWNGTEWSRETTTNPASPPPGQAPPRPAGPPSPNKAWPFIIGAALLVVALILGFAFLPGLLAPSQTPTTAPPPPTTSATGEGPTSPPNTTAPLNCAGGNGVTQPKAAKYQAGGFNLTVPASWTFRYDMSQWSWIDDAANWGTPSDNSAGVSFGTLAGRNGFHEVQKTTEQVLECLTKYGWANSGYQAPVTASSAEVTVSGVKGWRQVVTLRPQPEKTDYVPYEVVLISLPVPNAIVHLTAFYPTTDAAAKQAVSQVVGSLSK